MVAIGFHAAHEQIGPSALLRDVQRAEQAGFAAAMCSDHVNPWSTAQGHSGHAWSWLGAALATTALSFGTVTAPGQRYHPVVTAQAAATLSAMFPGRFWLALGSGENINESVTGEPWPRKDIRQQRLLECVDIIRRLLAGETVTHDGLVTVENAKLWDRPTVPPRLIAPAVSVTTAAEAASWADGLITVNQPRNQLERMVGAYRDAGGRGPAMLQVHLCWAPTAEEAMAIARAQWPSSSFGPPLTWDLPTVEHFDALGRHASDDDIRRSALISADLGQHAAWLHELAEVGFDELYLHHIGQDQSPFIDTFAEKVLPDFRE